MQDYVEKSPKQSKKSVVDQNDGRLDREGFSLACFEQIKNSKQLTRIVNKANELKYSIRSQIEVYCAPQSRLESIQGNEQAFIPIRKIINPPNQDADDEEVILLKEFKEYVLDDLGLQAYSENPAEEAKLDGLLKEIGAIAADSDNSKSLLVKIEVLMAAMRLLSYNYAVLDKGSVILRHMDFRALSAQSIRILNKFTNKVNENKHAYETKKGVTLNNSKVVYGMFKSVIETRTIEKKDMMGDSQSNWDMTSLISKGKGGDNSIVQLIPIKEFYASLVKEEHKDAVRQGTMDVPNLRNFLRFNKDEHNSIMVKKLVKAVDECNRNLYLQQFGTQKMPKLPAAPEPFVDPNG